MHHTEHISAAPIKTSSSAGVHSASAAVGGTRGDSFSGLPGALIALACILFLVAAAAIVYLCVIKRR